MDKQISILLERYEKGLATDSDLQKLNSWYESFEDKPDVLANLTSAEKGFAKSAMFRRISDLISKSAQQSVSIYPNPFLRWRGWVAAASILLLLSVASYLAFERVVPSQVKVDMGGDLKPGSDKAILTLADGQQIDLTEAKNGKLAIQGSTVITKTAEGNLVYGGGNRQNKPLINKISTPRGGEYQLKLADGTRVWLNAASSVSYPSVFQGRKREVEITGEVYFEVAHNAKQPFVVKSGEQTITVLGTRFNVNAYPNEESVNTTLLEGSVAVRKGSDQHILKPGQQAQLRDSKINVSNVDAGRAVAWKDGYFEFEDADIETVMRQVSRWYDVEVTFVGQITKQTFTGRVSKYRSINKVLDIISSYDDVDIAIEGRRIMVK